MNKRCKKEKMKIFDCFPFFNEIDTVEIRFAELYDTVDKFFVAESTKTHSGLPKPLYFRDNISRYDAFKDKIVHIIIDDMPSSSDHWEREKYQRDIIARSLKNHCSPDDLIISSDCDEIPRAETIRQIDIANGIIGNLSQNAYQYYYNLKGHAQWCMGKVFKFSTLKTFGTLSNIRNSGVHLNFQRGGWHFGYMGGPESVLSKIRSFAHQELNIPAIASENRIRANINSRFAPWDFSIHPQGVGTHNDFWQFVELDDLPKYLFDNQVKFKKHITQPTFTKYLYDIGCMKHLGQLCIEQLGKEGKIIEIGSFEGCSTVYLANSCYPEKLSTVDLLENENLHTNINCLTYGNVEPIVGNGIQFLNEVEGPIKFLHLDANINDLSSLLDVALPKMKGIICGYGFNDHFKTILDSKIGQYEVSGPFWFRTE